MGIGGVTVRSRFKGSKVQRKIRRIGEAQRHPSYQCNRHRVMRNSRMAVSIVLVIALCIASSHRAGLAASAPLEKLTIGWSAIAGSQAPFWITKDAGLFEKNGLDVIMIYLDGGSQATQAMMSGELPVAHVGGKASVVAKLRGPDVQPIARLLNMLTYS